MVVVWRGYDTPSSPSPEGSQVQPVAIKDSSNLTINEPFIARMFANSCAQLLCQRGEIVIECSLIGYWLLY